MGRIDISTPHFANDRHVRGLQAHDIKSRGDNMAECCPDGRQGNADILKGLLRLTLQIARTDDFPASIHGHLARDVDGASSTTLDHVRPAESRTKPRRIVKFARHGIAPRKSGEKVSWDSWIIYGELITILL